MFKHSFFIRSLTFALTFLLCAAAYLPAAPSASADEPDDEAAVAAAGMPEFLDDALEAQKKKDRERDERRDDRSDDRRSSSAQRAFVGEVKVKGGATLLVMDRAGRTALAYATERTVITAQGSDQSLTFGDISVDMRVSVYGLQMDASDLPHLAAADLETDQLQTHRDNKPLTVIEARRITLPKNSSSAGTTVGVVRAISSSSVTVMGIDGHDHTASLTGAIILSETPVLLATLWCSSPATSMAP